MTYLLTKDNILNIISSEYTNESGLNYICRNIVSGQECIINEANVKLIDSNSLTITSKMVKEQNKKAKGNPHYGISRQSIRDVSNRGKFIGKMYNTLFDWKRELYLLNGCYFDMSSGMWITDYDYQNWQWKNIIPTDQICDMNLYLKSSEKFDNILSNLYLVKVKDYVDPVVCSKVKCNNQISRLEYTDSYFCVTRGDGTKYKYFDSQIEWAKKIDIGSNDDDEIDA